MLYHILDTFQAAKKKCLLIPDLVYFILQILDTNPQLYFHLQQQRLIELIRSGKIEEALEFAQEELAPRGEENVIPSFIFSWIFIHIVRSFCYVSQLKCNVFSCGLHLSYLIWKYYVSTCLAAMLRLFQCGLGVKCHINSIHVCTGCVESCI